MNSQTLITLLVDMKNFVVFLIFLLSFPIHGSSEIFENPIRYCSNATFLPNSTYLSNLKILSSALSSNASHKLYHNSSVGRPPNPTAYGDFQCRGDLDATACRQCVATATSSSSQKLCPLSVEAFFWLDKCVLRYSNRSFFSVLVEEPSLIAVNVVDVDVDVDAFDEVVVATLNATARNASTSKFASNEVGFGNYETVYTVAQCSGDLSNFDCGRCLRRAVRKLPYCCSGKMGARILSPSCMIRYELYPFYRRVSAPAPVVPPPPPPPDFNPSSAPSAAAAPLLSGKGRAAVAMVIGGVVGVVGYFL